MQMKSIYKENVLCRKAEWLDGRQHKLSVTTSNSHDGRGRPIPLIREMTKLTTCKVNVSSRAPLGQRRNGPNLSIRRCLNGCCSTSTLPIVDQIEISGIKRWNVNSPNCTDAWQKTVLTEQDIMTMTVVYIINIVYVGLDYQVSTSNVTDFEKVKRVRIRLQTKRHDSTAYWSDSRNIAELQEITDRVHHNMKKRRLDWFNKMPRTDGNRLPSATRSCMDDKRDGDNRRNWIDNVERDFKQIRDWKRLYWVEVFWTFAPFCVSWTVQCV